MSHAFFGTFFRVERKYDPPSGRQPHRPRRSRRVRPRRQKACTCGRTKGLSSGQTIGAVRTAVRSACCLPELRVANRLRRLYPLDDGELFKFNLKSSVCQRQTGLPKGNPPCVFPSFPFGSLRGPESWGVYPHGETSPPPRAAVGEAGRFSLFPVFFASLLPRQPVLVQHGDMGPGHDRVAWKMLALAAEVQPPLLYAIPGKAVSRNMGFLAAGAAAFQVRGTGAAVKTASAE